MRRSAMGRGDETGGTENDSLGCHWRIMILDVVKPSRLIRNLSHQVSIAAGGITSDRSENPYPPAPLTPRSDRGRYRVGDVRPHPRPHPQAGTRPLRWARGARRRGGARQPDGRACQGAYLPLTGCGGIGAIDGGRRGSTVRPPTVRHRSGEGAYCRWTERPFLDRRGQRGPRLPAANPVEGR
jgi:hypothetical protein